MALARLDHLRFEGAVDDWWWAELLESLLTAGAPTCDRSE
jgi:hypothetical protein